MTYDWLFFHHAALPIPIIIGTLYYGIAPFLAPCLAKKSPWSKAIIIFDHLLIIKDSPFMVCPNPWRNMSEKY